MTREVCDDARMTHNDSAITDPDQVIDVTDAMRILDMYRVAVLRAVHSGHLTAYRHGKRGTPYLFLRADVLDYQRRLREAYRACAASGVVPRREHARLSEADR